MADRSIIVRLGANISDYQREMAKAVTPLDELVRKSGDASGQASTAMGKIAQSVKHQGDSWRTAGTSLVAYGAGMTGLLATVAKTGIAYNTLQQTSRAALTTILGGSQAAAEQMAKFDDFARTSPFSKATFLEAQQQMLGFGIEAQKVIPYLDAIQNATAAVGGNNQTISELSRIMSQISSSAKITATDLREFGNRGIDAAALIGSQMGKTAAQIREDITDGALDAGQALDALAAGMQERFDGAAAGVKNTMEGALDRVKAAWRDLSASIMSSAVDPDGGGWLVGLTNGIADLIRLLDRIPDPILRFTAGLGAVSGATALAAGGIMTLLPKLLEMHTAWSNLASAWPGLVSVLGRLGAAAPIAAAALGALNAILGPTVEWHQRARQAVDDYTTVLGENSGALDDNTAAQNENVRMAVAKRLQDEGVLDIASQLGVTLSDVTDAVLGEAGAYERVQAASQEHVEGVEALIAAKQAELDALEAAGPLTDKQAIRYNDLTNELEQLNGEASVATGLQRDLASAIGDEGGRYQEGVEQARQLKAEQEQLAIAAADAVDPQAQLGDAVGDYGVQAESSAEASAGYAAALEESKKANEELADALQETIDGLLGYYDAVMSAENSAIALESSYDKAAEALKKNGETLDINTEKGRDNRKALLEIASAALRNAEDMNAAQASTEDMASSLERAREKFVSTATQMGMTGDEANAYADELGLIPDAVVTAITLPAVGDAMEQAAEMYRLLDQLPPEVRSQIKIDVDLSGYHTADRVLNSINGRTVTAAVAIRQYGQGALASGGYAGHIQRFAGGGWPRREGYVLGPGTTTSDHVPSLLSVKEFVNNARSVQYYGLDAMYALNARRGDRESVRAAVGLAGGGSPLAGAARYTQSVVPTQIAYRSSMPSRAATPLAPREDHFHVHGTDPRAVAAEVYAQVRHERQKEAVER